MLEPEAPDRAKMEEIFAHPWMQGPVPTESEVRVIMQRLLHEKHERDAASKGETHQEEYLGNDR